MTRATDAGITAALFFGMLAVVVQPPPLNAQDRPFPCPRPETTFETIVDQIERISAGDLTLGQPTISASIHMAIVRPFISSPCPIFSEAVDQRDVMIRLLRYAADHDDGRVAGPLMEYGSALAFRLEDELMWSPTDFLFEAVKSGRTSAARWQALSRLVSKAMDPGIRGRLVGLARRPVGPESWPALPADLIHHLQFIPTAAARALEADLFARPDRIRQPLGRWVVECRGATHGPPMAANHPCHPANAPPRLRQ